MSLDYGFAWMMVLLRSIGIIIQLPVIAGRPIPIPLRVALGACLATLLAGVVPSAPITLAVGPLVSAAAMEVILGLALGFVTRMAFAAVDMAGRVISSEIGLMATPGLGVPEPANEPLAGLLSAFAVVLFFLFGGHQSVLTAFARSFSLAAAGRGSFDAGVAEFAVEEVDLRDLVRHAIGRSAAGVPLRIDTGGEGATVLGDKRRLERVVANLVENAAVYGGGATEVAVTRADGSVRVLVDDQGAGVPPAERRMVFDRFFRGSAAGRRGVGGGSGLGLALVAEHVHLHGGEVWVEDGPNGRGARFVVEIPASSS